MKKINCNPDNYYTLYLQQKSLMLHDQRIKNVQPTLRGLANSSVRSSMHIKKQPLAELNRLLQIEIENKALLKKLTDKTKSTLSHSKSHKLIKNNRKKNIQSHERNLQNIGLVKRLKQAKSSYQCSQFAEDRRKTQRFLQTRTKNSKRNLSKVKQLLEKSRCDQNIHNFSKSMMKQNFNFTQAKSFHENPHKNGKLVQIVHLKKIRIKSSKKQMKAFLKGTIWQNFCCFEISVSKQQINSFKIVIPKQDFDVSYSGNINTVINSIFYDKQKGQLLLFPSSSNEK